MSPLSSGCRRFAPSSARMRSASPRGTKLPPDTKEEHEEGNHCAKGERERHPSIPRLHHNRVRESGENRRADRRSDAVQQAPIVVGRNLADENGKKKRSANAYEQQNAPPDLHDG